MLQVARLGAAYIMMHMRSLPRDMQSKENTTYEPNETAITIAGELQESIAQAVNAGVEPWRIIVDPGKWRLHGSWSDQLQVYGICACW